MPDDVVYLHDDKRMVEIVATEENGDLHVRNVLTPDIDGYIYAHERHLWHVVERKDQHATAA
jgi:hypothetical protein